MIFLRAVLTLLGLGLAVQIILAAGAADILAGFATVAANPWGLAGLVDLYLGFIVAAVLVYLLEPDRVVRWLVIVPLFIFGNPLLAFWAAWRLPDIVARLRAVRD